MYPGLREARELEKQYLAAHAVAKTRKEMRAAEQAFVSGLKALGIQDIKQYHKLVAEWGASERQYNVYKDDSEMLPFYVERAMASGIDAVLYSVADKPTVYIDTPEKSAGKVDIDFCRNEGITLISTGVDAAHLSVEGNPSMLLVLRRPANFERVYWQMLEVIKFVVARDYGVEIQTYGNDLMAGKYIPERKVLGGAMSPINDDWVRIGLGLSVVYDKQLGEQIFKEKPSAKEPGSLSEIVDGTIEPDGFVNAVLDEWFRRTSSSRQR